MAPSYPYPYPVTNSELIRLHKLESHLEGGFFAETAVLASEPSKAAPQLPPGLAADATKALEGKAQVSWGAGAQLLGGQSAPSTAEGTKVDATQIYYLLTADSYRGKMHFNLHAHFHLLHSGRSLYTLIKPPTSPDETPEVHRIIMGHDAAAGEVSQLFVPGGWWKASEIPEEDRLLLDAPDVADLKERIGCLVSEIVVPGWNPDQHLFIDEDKLKAMWGGKPGWEPYMKYMHSA
ncbi:hypothetical protein JCM24511_05744 [Saitozyma sp. JCM 24511]|nr:hypothetical protein JCM24511_05744 [Saitozyma sp. JCM 24511]